MEARREGAFGTPTRRDCSVTNALDWGVPPTSPARYAPREIDMTTGIAVSTAYSAGVMPRVARVTAHDALVETSIVHFERQVAAESGRESESAREWAGHLSSAAAPMRALIDRDPRAVASLDALQTLAAEEYLRRAEVFDARAAVEGSRTLSFTASPGFQVIAPPYDLAWTSGMMFANKDTGKLVATHSNGESTTAVGAFLTSPVRSLVRVAPFAPFSYLWGGFERGAPVFTRGSVGVVVYAAGDPRPALDYRAELWKTWIAGRDSGSGSSTIGEALRRDVLITMEPGTEYLVWVWCSVASRSTLVSGHEGFASGQIACEVPFMVVDAGPAPYVR
jgi:hypothetical protein